MIRSTLIAVIISALAGGTTARGTAQEPGLKLAVGDFGLGIGDVPRLDGLRLNFRDRRLERVRGINATIWSPHEDVEGSVTGLALGVPLTGARTLSGLAIGLGVAALERFDGIGLAPLGMGAGQRLRGIMLGGLGVGSGRGLSGLAIGGLGVGAGGGGDVSGIAIGGLGIGAGGDARGLLLGMLGAGVGRDVRGIALGGLGVGVGGETRGLVFGGVGVGTSRLRGAAVSAVSVWGGEMRGLVIAPAYFRLEQGGLLRGVSVSAFNHVRGRQHGLTIGLLNIADELHGLQVGILNIARNKRSFRVMPLVNYSR